MEANSQKPKAVKLLEQLSDTTDKPVIAPKPVAIAPTSPSKKDVAYYKKLNCIISLLSPLLVSPQANGETFIKYAIEVPEYREQLQDYMMQITKKHLNLK